MESDKKIVEKDVFLLLNFKEKIEQKFFTKNNLFFKIVNLHTKRPFVQLGSHVFNGTYEDVSFGTNLFFEEQDEPRNLDIYEKETPINLKFIGKTAKVLTLRWQKVPDEIIDIDSKELMELDFKVSYDTVMNKIEKGSLDINDIIKKEGAEGTTKLVKPEEPIKMYKQLDHQQEEPCLEQEMREETPELKKQSVANERYDLLKAMVEKPVKVPEYYHRTNLEDITSDQDFSILKELYLKSLDYKNLSLKIDDSITNYVDIEASINDGIISRKEISKLTEYDKQLLISIRNFDNLSIPMKLTLLIEHIKEEKQHLGTLNSAELKIMDEHGRTAKDRYRLLKSLAKDLQYYLFLRVWNNNLYKKVVRKSN